MSSTALETKPDEDAPAAPAKPPYWDVLPLDVLDVDATYQRPLTTFVEKIQRKFDLSLLGVLCVSKRSAKQYAIIDGQTRAAALHRLGFEEAPCLVYEGLSHEREAWMFAQFQTARRAVHPADLFRSQVTSGDPNLVALHKLLAEHNFSITATRGEPREFVVPGALKWVWHGCQSGEAARNVEDVDTMRRLLEAIEAAWPTLPDSAKGAMIVKGLGVYLKAHPKINMQRLAKRLSVQSPKEWEDRAKLQRRARDGRGSSHGALAEIIDDAYKAH